MNERTLDVYLAEPRGFCTGVRRAVGIVEEALAEGRDLPDEVSEFSLEWGELAETLAGNHDREAIRQAVHDELGSVCYRILGNTAVFKQKATTQTFLESLGFAAR